MLDIFQGDAIVVWCVCIVIFVALWFCPYYSDTYRRHRNSVSKITRRRR